APRRTERSDSRPKRCASSSVGFLSKPYAAKASYNLVRTRTPPDLSPARRMSEANQTREFSEAVPRKTVRGRSGTLSPARRMSEANQTREFSEAVPRKTVRGRSGTLSPSQEDERSESDA